LISKTNAAQFYRNAGGFAQDSGRIFVEYVNWTNVQQRAELSYQHPVGLELRSFMELNRYRGAGGTVGTIYHVPAYEAGVQGLFNLKGKVRLETDLRWVGPRDVPGTAADALPSYVDWRMGVYYQYNKQLQAYINGTNLLNSKYALWQGYTVQGIRGVLGLAYKF
jgi:outer membrane receptor protein involved in Fe transport